MKPPKFALGAFAFSREGLAKVQVNRSPLFFLRPNRFEDQEQKLFGKDDFAKDRGLRGGLAKAAQGL
jgi:hypothetical protein